MKIIEIRDGFIKIESDKKIALSAFLHIKDEKNEFIAQVVQVKNTGAVYILYSKILFNYCGAYLPYNNILPEKSAVITEYTQSFISEKFAQANTSIIGEFVDNNAFLPIETDALNKKTLFSIDDSESIKNIVSTLKTQLSKKTPFIVLEMLGLYSSQEAVVAGVDFKLPLNTESLSFIYEDCLNDVTSESKVLIKDIFGDLAEYSKTVPFLPFATLKNIVSDLVEKSHIFKLLALKNKLVKFDKLGYFANSSEEAVAIESYIKKPNLVINFSKLDGLFQNRYLSVIYSIIKKNSPDAKICVLASNLIDKKNLKNVLTNEDYFSIFITHSKFKYLKEIKSLFNNFVIESSLANNELFKAYFVFLKAMNKDNLLYVGKFTDNLPFVITNKEIEITLPEDENTGEAVIEQEGSEVVSEESSALEEILNDAEEQTVVAEFSEEHAEEDLETLESESIEIIEQKSNDLIERVSEEIEETVNPANLFTESVEDDSNDVDDEDQPSETLSVSDLEDNIPVEPAFTEDFHTKVNEETLIDVPQEIAEISDNSIADEVVEFEGQENDTAEEKAVIEEEVFVEENSSQVDIEEAELSVESENILSERAEIIDSSVNNLEESEMTFEDELSESDLGEVVSDINTDGYSEEGFAGQPNSFNEDSDEGFDEIIELDDDDDTSDAILIDIEDESEAEDVNDLDKSIIEDVDKVFTTMKDDSISESDLDFIDELNSEELSIDEHEIIEYADGLEELTELEGFEDVEDEILTPLTEVSDSDNSKQLEVRDSSATSVPIYDAEISQEDIISSDPIDQGDSVRHAKYGTGIVEKKIKYGTKTLFSINFENVGRRLLDPTLTEIRKN